jgi:hypothetical protein
VSVSWHKVCKPTDEGGLGLGSLIKLNEASILKLGWELINSNEPWAISPRNRALNDRKPVKYHIFSSIWSSVKSDYPNLIDISCWLLGNGDHINIWSGSWCGSPIGDRLNLPQNLMSQLSSKVSNIIIDFNWYIPPSLHNMFPTLNQMVAQVSIPKLIVQDKFISKCTST